MLSQEQLNYLKKVGELIAKMTTSKNNVELNLMAVEANLCLQRIVKEDMEKLINQLG